MLGCPKEGSRVRLKTARDRKGFLETYEVDEGRIMAFVRWDDEELQPVVSPYDIEEAELDA